jgi:hypothetical protein
MTFSLSTSPLRRIAPGGQKNREIVIEGAFVFLYTKVFTGLRPYSYNKTRRGKIFGFYRNV